ncbi:MAG: response regulator transcription factor [Armatimonadetes bacterium]|jgi:DNA-binding response OmpR family regulator|nr:response regulator transcription factor [Armatimonadota bacterium]
MTEGTLLLVEDDPQLCQVLATQLEQKGWKVHTESYGSAALEAFARWSPDLVLLDIGLEDMDGFQVCRALRRMSNVPIILVTAADTTQSKITALELGGDDYLTKPFYLGELLARIKAVLRRTRGGGMSAPGKCLTLGELTISLAQREVRRKGTLLKLTKTEFDILQELAMHLDEVLTYDFLLRAIWGSGHEDVRALHVHISNLRRKLEPDVLAPHFLTTVPGVGYRMRSFSN